MYAHVSRKSRVAEGVVFELTLLRLLYTVHRRECRLALEVNLIRFYVFAYRLATRTESPPTLARRQILTKEFYSCRLVLSSPPPVFHYAPQSQFFSILALKISNMFLPHLLVVFL